MKKLYYSLSHYAGFIYAVSENKEDIKEYYKKDLTDDEIKDAYENDKEFEAFLMKKYEDDALYYYAGQCAFVAHAESLKNGLD